MVNRRGMQIVVSRCVARRGVEGFPPWWSAWCGWRSGCGSRSLWRPLVLASGCVVEDAAAGAAAEGGGAEVDGAGWLHGERAWVPGDQARGDVPPADTVIVAAIDAECLRDESLVVPRVDAARGRWIGGDDVRALGCVPAGRPGPGAARVGADIDPAAAACFDRREQPLVVVRVDGERDSVAPRRLGPPARCPRRTAVGAAHDPVEPGPDPDPGRVRRIDHNA